MGGGAKGSQNSNDDGTGNDKDWVEEQQGDRRRHKFQKKTVSFPLENSLSHWRKIENH
jgi:hypothetical protein